MIPLINNHQSSNEVVSDRDSFHHFTIKTSTKRENYQAQFLQVEQGAITSRQPKNLFYRRSTALGHFANAGNYKKRWKSEKVFSNMTSLQTTRTRLEWQRWSRPVNALECSFGIDIFLNILYIALTWLVNLIHIGFLKLFSIGSLFPCIGRCLATQVSIVTFMDSSPTKSPSVVLPLPPQKKKNFHQHDTTCSNVNQYQSARSESFALVLCHLRLSTTSLLLLLRLFGPSKSN